MKLSIITPVLNGERWIRGCLENVISQGCADIEHIVMDGGSTDRTMAIARDIAAEHDHIRLWSCSDTGQSHALNRAIQMARGDYIGILNVDDFYEPGTLNRVVELIGRANDPAMFVGNCNVLDDEGFKRLSKPVLDIDMLLLGAEFPLNPSSYFYPARLHERIGYYDEREHFTMDADFLFSALPNIRVAYFDEVWGNYRRLKGTKTFEDYVSGDGPKRLRRLYRKHYLRRPMRSKVKIAVRSVIWPMAARWRRYRTIYL